MLAYFATEYTIHFDDTMAYGSHHFLTAFKFQCAARESFLFGETIFDIPGVKEALDGVHLLTADAYARNLSASRLGDRVAILLTIEDWGLASARFCYRVLGDRGQSVMAGFQTLICADAATGNPIPIPPALRDAMDAMREIEEVREDGSFRDRVLAGGAQVESLFGEAERSVAARFLQDRYPAPGIITPQHSDPDRIAEQPAPATVADVRPETHDDPPSVEAWVFAGQGAFDPSLFCERVASFSNEPSGRDRLDRCVDVAEELLGGDARGLLSGSTEHCKRALDETPELLQVAIHLQNVLGAMRWIARGRRPEIVMGHSFGEIAAFQIAGCFDLATAVHVVCARAQAIASHAPPGGALLVAATNRHLIETEATLSGLDQVAIAGRNHDRQTVLSGPLGQLERLQRVLGEMDIATARIPSPTSFHHPLLRIASAEWLERLRRLPFREPVHAIYSPIGRRFIMPHEDIAAILASQLVRPFDLKGGVDDVISIGVNHFVDCGSKGTLAGLIAKSCPEGVQVRRAEFETLDPPPEPAVASEPAVAPKPLAEHARASETSELRSEAANLSTVPRVAIVASGCILPGGARSPNQLYQAIYERREGIVDQRQFDPHWSEDFFAEPLQPDRSTSHLTGRVDDADIVAPPNVDPDVFDAFTRSQKLLCIALAPCVETLQDAQRIACLIGATADGFEDQDEVASLVYAGIDPTSPEVDSRLGSERSVGQTPHSAVQEVFDRVVRPGLKVTLIDAACASSLYTTALGIWMLESDQADAVIAGGCFCPGPGNSCLFSQFNGTTATGCRPFDAGADGVVFSEGAALVSLRRRADAQRLGLDVHATILGAGLSSDGRSPSANVPKSAGQALSLQRCYDSYDIDRRSIDAIEGHGTSTLVGDSTELETLRGFFADQGRDPIPVHSLKGLLGHAGWAAGTASVIAACEYLRNRVFPPQAHHRQPSPALLQSQGTLTVPTRPVPLPSGQCRVAIDGFGFGGANGHLVLEPAGDAETQTTNSLRRDLEADAELVIVASADISPTVATANGNRFDRDAVRLPKGHIVLPDLAGDLDISQVLAVTLTDQIIAQLPQFDDSMRRETSLLLALRGKTERGVEATMRILTPRLRRGLQGDTALIQRLESAHNRARPSGAYTLQCMMPNVAPGRAALLHNLNGPNFVVDAGEDSLMSTIESAELLLRGGRLGGTRIAVVAAVKADSNSLPDPGAGNGDEFAAAFAVTTRQFAAQQGLPVIGTVDQIKQAIGEQPTFPMQVEAATRTLRAPAGSDSAPSLRDQELGEDLDSCRIHVPVWVEHPIPIETRSRPGQPAVVVLAPAKPTLIRELLRALPDMASRFSIAVVGDSASDVARGANDPRVVEATVSSFASLDEFAADVVIAVDTVDSWDLAESMSAAANDNSLCESLFQFAQASLERLRGGELEVWGLFVEGYRGEAHPRSGGVAGLLKSIRREIPGVRGGCVCTRGLGVGEALGRVSAERRQADSEPELVFDHAERLVRRFREPSPPVRSPRPLVELDADSVVVATGGAKGVTAVMLEALLRDSHCNVIAIGRSPLEKGPDGDDEARIETEFYQRFLSEHPGTPPVEMRRRYEAARARWEAHQTIENLKSIGGNVQYVVADVTDRNQVDQLIHEIETQHGRIDLLVHGAGIQLSKRLEHRTLDEFRRTYAVKVGGLNHLAESYRSQFGETLRAHVLTSAYSVFGNDGQHDYGAANETMDRLCAMSRLEGERWSSIAWLAWEGIGMTRGSEYRVLAEQRKLSGVGPKLGQHLFREVISGRTHSAINVPMTASEHVEYAVSTIPPEKAPPQRILEIAYPIAEISCLPFHKIRDTPTLPGAWILDALVTAAVELDRESDSNQVIVEDLQLSRFVRFVHAQDPNVRVIVEQRDESIVASMIADVLHKSGRVLSRDVLCAQAKLAFAREATPASSLELNGRPMNRADDPYCHGVSDVVRLSGPFDCLQDIAIGPTGRRASYRAGNVRLSQQIPAMLLDAAWRVGAMHADKAEDLYVPVRIGKIVLPLGSPPADSTAGLWEIRSAPPTLNGGDACWSRTEVFDETGALRLIVEDAFAKRLH